MSVSYVVFPIQSLWTGKIQESVLIFLSLLRHALFSDM